jgi:hypothetical protein
MISAHSLSSFCTVNELEKSMSYVEKAAKKLLPKMIPDKKRTKNDNKSTKSGKAINEDTVHSDFEDDDDIIVDLSKIKGKHQKSKVI